MEAVKTKEQRKEDVNAIKNQEHDPMPESWKPNLKELKVLLGKVNLPNGMAIMAIDNPQLISYEAKRGKNAGKLIKQIQLCTTGFVPQVVGRVGYWEIVARLDVSARPAVGDITTSGRLGSINLDG